MYFDREIDQGSSGQKDSIDDLATMSYLLIKKNDRYRRNSPISSAHRLRGGGGNQSRQDPSLSHGGGWGSGGGNSFVVPWLRSSSSGSRNGTGAFHHHSSNGAYRSDANDHSGDSGVAVANYVGGRVQLQRMAPQVQHQQPQLQQQAPQLQQQQQGQQQNIQGLVSTDEGETSLHDRALKPRSTEFVPGDF